MDAPLAHELEEDEIHACPECDSPDVIHKQPSGFDGLQQDPHDYRCNNCRHHFDVPVVRKRKNKRQERTASPAANALIEADPETEIRLKERDVA